MNRDTMKRVFIIRNNMANREIYSNASESFEEKGKGEYYVRGKNKESLNRVAKKGDRGLVLLLTYNADDPTKILDIFIGDDAEMISDERIEYSMKRHLEGDNDLRAIDSIIDKIDLDITHDFEENTYVMVSDMQSLYEELKDRINSLDVKIEADDTVRKPAGDYCLCALAQTDAQARRAYKEEPVMTGRTEFQRDRERIVNSTAFRRMVDKAQIFSAEKGDYFRTRMTHTLEVNQIAKAIAYALHLNLDLTEAIALGHDLGHTPFGHQGERTLNDILSGKIDAGIVTDKKKLEEERCYGGFKHNYQSARILTQLENKYVDFAGLNVSAQVVEGVLKHTKLKKDIRIEDFVSPEYLERIYIDENEERQPIASLEGQVVAIADEIAQRGHDVDDALTSGVMTVSEFMDRLKIDKCDELRELIEKEIEKTETANRLLPNKQDMQVARIVHRIIRYFISDVINNSKEKIESSTKTSIDDLNKETFINFSEKGEKVNKYMEKIVQKKVICNYEVARADYNAEVVVKTLFQKYYENPRLLHTGTLQKIFHDTLMHKNTAVSNSAVCLNDCSVSLANAEIEEMALKPLELPNDTKAQKTIRLEKRKILIRNIVDFIAGMTDGYALQEYEKIK